MTPEENYRYHKRYRYDRARGIRRNTDPEPVRNHIAALLGAGASYRAVAEAAGVSVQAVSRIHRGQKNVRRDTAAKIMGVTTRQIRSRDHGDKFVPDLGARRRIRAMMALGHSHDDIAAAAGWGTRGRAVANILNQKGSWITQAKHDSVVGAYRSLSMRPGDNLRTKAVARRRGYPGPMAWDDIDDPDEAPEIQSIDDSVRTSTTMWGVANADSLADCAWWGLTVQQAARRLGVVEATIVDAVARLAPELREAFARNAVAQEFREHRIA